MIKSMLPLARWKKSNGQINVAYGKGGKKPMVKSMLPMATVENKTMVNQWSFPSSFRNQWKPMDKNTTNVSLKHCEHNKKVPKFEFKYNFKRLAKKTFRSSKKLLELGKSFLLNLDYFKKNPNLKENFFQVQAIFLNFEKFSSSTFEVLFNTLSSKCKKNIIFDNKNF